MSPNTTTAKQAQRAKIAADTARFIASGGQIQQVTHGATGDPCARIRKEMQNGRQRARRAS